MSRFDVCHGNDDTHCCYVNGEVCPFLEENTVEGRRWACGLYRELGDWNLVHTDQRYLETVQVHWIPTGTPDCGNWFGPGCCFNTTINDEGVRETYEVSAAREGTPVEIRQFWGVE